MCDQRPNNLAVSHLQGGHDKNACSYMQDGHDKKKFIGLARYFEMQIDSAPGCTL
jgi:hypothetical protein